MPGKLIVAGWHIGNINDLPNRTREALMSADMILCENVEDFIENCKRDKVDHIDDVRNILEFNDASMHSSFINYLNEDKEVVLVCYEGMPTIADPGQVLVQIATSAKIEVDVIPGPVAPISCLAISGFKTDKFLIEKEFTKTPKEKIEYFNTLKDFNGSIILFEEYDTIIPSIKAIKEVFKNTRRIGLFVDITMPSRQIITGMPDKVLEEALKLNLHKHIKITLIINGYIAYWHDENNYGD
jgi:16S rRNA (cytidine1402-2'-O)-methyltransferase